MPLSRQYRLKECLLVTMGLASSNFPGTLAFPLSSSPPLQSRSLSSTPLQIGTRRLFLYVDTSNHGEFPRESVDSSNSDTKTNHANKNKDNQWGIPDCRTLDPFSTKPVEQLENGGKVTLVGSGPGDPDLLTVKAWKLLQDPNALVIVDRLVSQEILDLIQGEIKVARKLPGCADLAQEEIYWWTYQGLQAGKHVIRLKIGDPFVFGRGGEEILMFRHFGVEAKVIPVRVSNVFL